MSTRVQRIPGITITDPDWPVVYFPNIESDLLVDFNADTLGDVASDVTTWSSSAGSLVVTMATTSSSKPTVVAGPNGHKAVQAVAGSSEYIRTGAITPLELPMTQALVVRKDALASQSILSGLFSSGTSKMIGLTVNSTSWLAGAGAVGELTSTIAGDDTTDFHVVIIRHGADAAISVDGEILHGSTGVAAPSLATLPVIGLFANSAYTAGFASASVARLMMYSRALNDTDIAALHAALSAEYAL